MPAGDALTLEAQHIRASVSAASTRHSILSTAQEDMELTWQRTSVVQGNRSSVEEPAAESEPYKAGLKDITLACWCIIIIEFAERFSFFSFQQLFPPFTKDMLNMNDSSQVLATNVWQFWNYVTPLFGAYISDACERTCRLGASQSCPLQLDCRPSCACGAQPFERQT